MSHLLSKRCLTVAMLAALPLCLAGCLAINAALGVLGLVATGPVQYAGTAYTVGEYAYHYAVNNMTPVEVFEDKFAWLDGTDAPPTPLVRPESPPPTPLIELADAGGADAEEADAEVIAAESTTAEERDPHRTPPAPPLRPSVPTAAPEPATTPEPVMVASRAPLQPAAPRPMRGQDRTAQPAASKAATGAPKAGAFRALAVIPADANLSRPDPLAARLDRLESTLAQAERMYLRHQEQGVRCGASTAEHSGDEAGVSGTGMVRHPVMRTGPGPIASLRAAARHTVINACPALT